MNVNGYLCFKKENKREDSVIRNDDLFEQDCMESDDDQIILNEERDEECSFFSDNAENELNRLNIIPNNLNIQENNINKEENKINNNQINNNNDIEEIKIKGNNKENNEIIKNEINKDINDNKEKDEDKKEIKDPLLEEDDLDEKEKIDDIINYLNGLDYDKYCKDMELREALSLLKHKMDKEKEEKALNNDINTENKEPQENKEEKNIYIIDNTLLPEIDNKIPRQNNIEIIDEEEEKRKEEIKKYKIAEQIAKSERMKKVHSVNSIKKLLQREGLDKINEPILKESPVNNIE